MGTPVKVGPGPGQVIYADGALWVADTSPFSVLRVEPSTGRVTTAVGTSPGPAGDFGIGSIGLRFGSLWVASNDSLTRIDPRTLQVMATVPMPRSDLIAFAAGAVWVLADPRSSSPTRYYPIKNTAALWEVDPKSNRVVGTPLHLNAVEPIALVASGRNLWLADYIRGTVTRVRLIPGSRR
jgi:streptogramin lyase